MMSLSDLAIITSKNGKAGTDKGFGGHNYTMIYTDYFEEIRNNKLNIVEIGVQYGGSLQLWESYFPNASITGIDIDKQCIKNVKDRNLNRTTVLIGSAAEQSIVNELQLKYSDGIDIIIDDGSHQTSDQLKSFELLFPLLKDFGYYFIEDVYPAYFGSQFLDYCLNLVKNDVYHWDAKRNVGYSFEGGSFYAKNIISINFHRMLIAIQKGPAEVMTR